MLHPCYVIGMSQIPPHFWLELLPAGLQAQEARSLRMEDRELLTAIGSSPSRVLDVFRRLRWTDSQAFQDSLSHMVMRQWVVAREQRSPDVQVGEGPGADGEGASDPLMALLARHAQEAPGFDGYGSPDFDDSSPSPPGVDGPPVDSDLHDLPESHLAHQEGLDGLQGEEGYRPASEGPDTVSDAGEETEVEADTGPLSGEGDDPREAELPSLVFSREDTAALLSAMGLNEKATSFSTLTPSTDPDPAPDPVPASPSHDALLKALLRGEGPPASVGPVVEVPEYGIPLADAPPKDRSDGFVRLRDAEKPSSPSPAEPTKPAPAKPTPVEEPVRPMTEAERRRQEARQQMLDAARREQAQRQAAKERMQALEAQKQAAAEKREETLKHQRAVEASQRTNTFLGRAERARRIRDGLPLDTGKNSQD